MRGFMGTGGVSNFHAGALPASTGERPWDGAALNTGPGANLRATTGRPAVPG